MRATIHANPTLTWARIEADRNRERAYIVRPPVKVRLPDPRAKVAFEYHGVPRLVVPERVYRAKDGGLTLFAWEEGESNVKQFRLEEMVGFAIAH